MSDADANVQVSEEEVLREAGLPPIAEETGFSSIVFVDNIPMVRTQTEHQTSSFVSN
jgi:hypothetical protein